VGEEQRVQFIVMEYVARHDNKDMIRQNGALVCAIRWIMRADCPAIELAHRGHIIHRISSPKILWWTPRL
jgi:serine/threonine protein kinase